MKKTLIHYYQSISLKLVLSMLLLLLPALLLLFFHDQFSLSAVKVSATHALAYVAEYRLRGILIFTIFYFVVCVLPTPFVSVFTLLAGYLFGNVMGLLIVSFASALGGSALFLITRYILRDWVEKHVVQSFSRLQEAANTDSFMVALSLRLIPGMPFPIPAVVLGMSRLSPLKFYVSTQLGLMASLFVYVNAGRSLAQIHSIQDIFSPQLVVSMLLLALVPLFFGIISRKSV
ncbi:MAG: putative membrane protein YdjX (TVP38/TMEM64 family) [Candidatus Endobugula sp.]